MPKVKITGLPQMKNGGYTVRRSNDRKGKTHVVIGPDGTKKYFGDPTMGEKGNSKNGKKAFYARHKHNLKNNPYFRAYAKATWADGGMVDMYEGGGEITPIYNPNAEGSPLNYTDASTSDVSFDTLFNPNPASKINMQAMGGLMYEDGGPTEPPIKSIRQQVDKTYVKSPNIIDINKAIEQDNLIKSLNLSGKYTAVAVPDYDSSFRGDSIRFYPGQTSFDKTPYIRDLGNLSGVSNVIPASKIAQLVKGKAARVYQDTIPVKANPNIMPYQKSDEYTNYYKALGGPIKAGEGYVQNEPSEGFAYGGAYATSDSPTPQRTSGLMNYLGYGKPRPFAMGGYNMYFDGGPSEPINPPIGGTSAYDDPKIKKAMQTYDLTRWKPAEEAKRYFISMTPTKFSDREITNFQYEPGKTWKKTVVDGQTYFDRPKHYAEDITERFSYVPVSNPVDRANMIKQGMKNPYGFQYMGDIIPNKQPVAPVTPPPTEPRSTVVTATDPRYRPVSEQEFLQKSGQKGVMTKSEPSGTPGVFNRFISYDMATPTKPMTTPVDANISNIGMAYGGKMPSNILRSRLEAHMSPEEADNYLANYADGGQAGTGILGNMTYNPRPWKYVGGGQLGPYPYSSYKTDLSEFKEGGIHIKPEKRGTFTAAATKHGMGVQEFARKVMANKEEYSPAMVKKANFARNAAKWHHAYGGYQQGLPKFYTGGDGPDNPPGFWDYAMSQSNLPRDPQNMETQEPGFMEYATLNSPYARGPRDMTDYTPPVMSERELNILANLRRQQDPNRDFNYYIKPENMNSIMANVSQEPNMQITDIDRSKMYEPDPNKDRGGKGKNKDRGDREGMDWYYASQYLQQAAPELSYLMNQGMKYDVTPERTYTPEQMSALEPLREVRSAERAAAIDLANKAGGSNYLAYRTALGAKSAAQRAKVLEDINQANIAARNQGQLVNLQNTIARDQADAQNKAQAITNYYKTLERLGTVGATSGRDVRADQMDKMKWEYLPDIYKAMTLDPSLMAKYEKGLGKKKKKNKTSEEEKKH